jgi:hypothetical protein
LAPSADAPAEVVTVFREILAATPRDHFQISDAPLIEGYAQAIVAARKAAIELDLHGPVTSAGKLSPWVSVSEKAHRALALLAARLRLSPQHRADSRSAGRRADGVRPSVYELLHGEDEDRAAG